jgi:hypothetical protein
MKCTLLKLAACAFLLAFANSEPAHGAFTLEDNATERVTGGPTPTEPIGALQGEPDPSLPDPAVLTKITALEADHKKLSDSHAELARPLEEALANRPFVRSEVRELAFEKNHAEMLNQLRSCIEMLSKFEALERPAVNLVEDVGALRSESLNKELYSMFDSLMIKSEALRSKIQSDLTKLRVFKTMVNDTLIEDVHRYNLKISFRSVVGISWIAAFLLMVGVFSYLLWKGKLMIPEGATMQFIAVILIIFVIILFGITDVMGENGVTGILAAIAGYILGKSGTDGTNNVAEIIRAARGESPKPPTSPPVGG